MLDDWAISARSEGWITPYLTFTSHVEIDSKESGVGELKRYGSQKRFILDVVEGLDRGIRHFVCLKARQLGISTECLLLDVFWLSIHDGLQGAIIFDTDANRDKFRILLERIVESLPAKLRVGIKLHNKFNLALRNGSVLDYTVAGVRKSSGGGLARSRAWNFVHATECSSWGSEEGVSSMMASLAQKHPHRLYIFESTARGFNLFRDMWEQAGDDPFTQKRFFIGWWAKEDYSLRAGTPEFAHYSRAPLSETESELIAEVKARYHVTISMEQLAWHRWMRSAKIGSDDMMNQEYPWTEDEAFISTGHSFFAARRVMADIKTIRQERVPFKGFAYSLGETFLATKVDQVDSVARAELRAWEDPHPNGVYVMGVDPAYGRSDATENHAIELFRCYADRCVQVAEYATDRPETYQVAWIMAHLAGSYKNIWINIDVNGPGPAIMKELDHLKQLMTSGYLAQQAAGMELSDVFLAVRWYLYHRPDSLGVGYAYGWKNNPDLDLLIMNQMRDSYALQSLKIRSVPLLEEMQRLVQDGGDIKPTRHGSDHRTHAAALAHKAYIDWVRPSMISRGHTYNIAIAEEAATRDRPQEQFHNMIVRDWFRQKETARSDEEIERAWR